MTYKLLREQAPIPDGNIFINKSKTTRAFAMLSVIVSFLSSVSGVRLKRFS
jgi:hypothetical protein